MDEPKDPSNALLDAWIVSWLRYSPALTDEQKARCVDRLKTYLAEMDEADQAEAILTATPDDPKTPE